MAELLIHLYSSDNPCSLYVEIESRWAKVKLWDAGLDHLSIPTLSIRPFDSSRDILYALPSGEGATNEKLTSEFDIHIPRRLAEQTKAHWVASAVDENILIQPMVEHGSLHSPLIALEMLMQTLGNNEGLLACDGGSLLLCTREEGRMNIELLPLSLELLLQEGPQRNQWLALFPIRKRIYVVGGEVNAQEISQLTRIQPYSFQPLPMQNVLALVSIHPSARATIESNVSQYALAVGLAAHLAKGELRPLIVC